MFEQENQNNNPFGYYNGVSIYFGDRQLRVIREWQEGEETKSESVWDIVLQSERPSAYHTPVVVDGEHTGWVANLTELQDAKWESVKASRELAINSPINYLGNLYDFDANGQKNLSDAVVAAQSAVALSIPFPDVVWTLADNTTATLTRDQLLAFPLVAGIQRKGAVHAYARTLREEIYKVDATVASVEAVVWEYTE